MKRADTIHNYREMMPDTPYQLRGASRVTFERCPFYGAECGDAFGIACRSYNTDICFYVPETGKMYARADIYNLSPTTTRHASEFQRFIFRLFGTYPAIPANVEKHAPHDYPKSDYYLTRAEYREMCR